MLASKGSEDAVLSKCLVTDGKTLSYQFVFSGKDSRILA